MKHRIRVAILLKKDSNILLVKHVDPVSQSTWWVPPGGGLENGDDSIFDCAIRETKEETNLDVEIQDIKYIREYLDTKNQTLNIEIFLNGKIIGGKISLKNIAGNGADEDYIKDVSWLAQEDLQDKIVYPEILKDNFWTNQSNNISYLGRQIN